MPHIIFVLLYRYMYLKQILSDFLIPVKWYLEETDILYYRSFYGTNFCKNSYYKATKNQNKWENLMSKKLFFACKLQLLRLI